MLDFYGMLEPCGDVTKSCGPGIYHKHDHCQIKIHPRKLNQEKKRRDLTCTNIPIPTNQLQLHLPNLKS